MVQPYTKNEQWLRGFQRQKTKEKKRGRPKETWDSTLGKIITKKHDWKQRSACKIEMTGTSL